MANQQFMRLPKESLPARARVPKPSAQLSRQSNKAVQREALATTVPSASQVMAMQQLIGNRAVSQMLQREVTVGPADDMYEREAERVASEVMRTPAPANAMEPIGGPAAHSTVQPHPSGASVMRSESARPESARPQPAGAQSGMSLPTEMRNHMEARFGTDFSHVRVHTGTAAAQINRSLDAEAFTHQNHIYMGAGAYNPRSPSGQQLLAHELTHVVQQTGTVQRKANKSTVRVTGKLPAQRVSTKKKKLYLDFIRMKRLDAQFDTIIAKKLGMKKAAKKKDTQSGGTYGHWWTEIGDLTGDFPGNWQAAESYGWWPKHGVGGTKATFKGVEGALNAGDRDDPHHGEDVKKDQMFHPVMELDTGADYVGTRTKVIDDVRKFSKGYSGKWQWAFGWGKNCHTFQQALKTSVGLHFQKGSGWFKKPDNVEGVAESAKKEKDKAENDRWNTENPGIDYKLTTEVPLKGGMMGEGEDVMAPAGSIVRLLTEGIDVNRLQGWNQVQFAWDRKYYSAYYDDVRKHADRL